MQSQGTGFMEAVEQLYRVACESLSPRVRPAELGALGRGRRLRGPPAAALRLLRAK